MVNVLNKFIPMPSIDRNAWLNLQKHAALLASSVSFDESGPLRTHYIWVLICFCSHASWETSSQAEDLEKLSTELKRAVLSSGRRAGAREGPIVTALLSPSLRRVKSIGYNFQAMLI